MHKILNKIKMTSNFSCKKTLICTRCGDCCRFPNNTNKTITESEDLNIRKAVYSKNGILYAYPLETFTLPLSIEEKVRFEKLSKKLNIKIDFVPKKIIIKNSKEIEIIDWSFDHSICPFLNNDNECLIYEDRATICKVFPKTFKEEFISKDITNDTQLSFDEALSLVKNILNT